MKNPYILSALAVLFICLPALPNVKNVLIHFICIYGLWLVAYVSWKKLGGKMI